MMGEKYIIQPSYAPQCTYRDCQEYMIKEVYQNSREAIHKKYSRDWVCTELWRMSRGRIPDPHHASDYGLQVGTCAMIWVSRRWPSGVSYSGQEKHESNVTARARPVSLTRKIKHRLQVLFISLNNPINDIT